MKTYALIVLFIVAFMFLAPIPRSWQDGAYNPVTGIAYCRTQTACLHEIGHALDDGAGWVSQSPEFAEAIKAYLYYGLHYEAQPLAAGIVELTYRDMQPQTLRRELYAYIFQQAEGHRGCVPDGLQVFYDWERAEQLMSKLSNNRIYILR